jgi:hypothetical protein
MVPVRNGSLARGTPRCAKYVMVEDSDAVRAFVRSVQALGRAAEL